MTRVLYAGEVITVYSTFLKGFDCLTMTRLKDERRHLKNALEKHGIEVDTIPTNYVDVEFPEKMEDLLKYDVVILSDVGSNSLLLHPEVIPGGTPHPNRLKLLKRYVEEEGKGFMMIGGYMSFQGIYGRANYKNTPIEEILPVELMIFDDRVEVPEGFNPRVVNKDHPVVKGIPERWPMFLGYNKTKLKDGATLLVEYNGDPIVAVWEYGKGRTLAFTPDCAPHWGSPEFLRWEYYSIFWKQAVEWLAKKI